MLIRTLEYEIDSKYTFKQELLEYNPIFKGKTALIGDYSISTSSHTRKVLKSLGFSVFVVRNKEEILEKVHNGYNMMLYFQITFIEMALGKNYLKN